MYVGVNIQHQWLYDNIVPAGIERGKKQGNLRCLPFMGETRNVREIGYLFVRDVFSLAKVHIIVGKR